MLSLAIGVAAVPPGIATRTLPSRLRPVRDQVSQVAQLNFVPDVDAHAVTGADAFVSRHGVFGNERMYRLEAVAAGGRRDPALSQRQILDEAARFLLGESTAAPDIVRQTTEDYLWAVTEAVCRLRSRAFVPVDENWRQYRSE